jgi:hypothetical protein
MFIFTESIDRTYSVILDVYIIKNSMASQIYYTHAKATSRTFDFRLSSGNLAGAVSYRWHYVNLC